MSLAEIFLQTAERRGSATALIEPDGRAASFAALARESALRAQAYAEEGIGAGDVVLVARGMSAELYVVLLALWRLGAVAMFPEPGAGLDGLRHAIAAANPKAMSAGVRGRLARAVVLELAQLPVLLEAPLDGSHGDGVCATLSPDAPALITFTSGSTGAPKGIVRSVGFLLLQHRLLEQVRTTTPDDVDLVSLPVFILSNLAIGATSVIPAGDLRRPGRMDGARLRQQIVSHGVTRVIAPPALCQRLAEAPPTDIRAIFTGGGPVFPNLWHSLRAAAPRARICAVYGSTEAEPIAHIDWDEITNADWEAMANGAGLLAGRPIAEIALALNGAEIEVAGAHVNSGYLNSADNSATKEKRDSVLWHRTGDCGRLDASGRLWLLGRKAAAANGLYPFAIETAALSWPGVRQAALVADGAEARLAVAGAGLNVTELRRRARELGVSDLVVMRSIPTDRRHNSKIDYARLRESMRNSRGL